MAVVTCWSELPDPVAATAAMLFITNSFRTLVPLYSEQPFIDARFRAIVLPSPARAGHALNPHCGEFERDLCALRLIGNRGATVGSVRGSAVLG